MKLNEFVTQTLQEIIDGVSSAQQHAKEKQAYINPCDQSVSGGGQHVAISHGGGRMSHGQLIEFDIAVTTSEGSEAKGGAGVFVVPLTLGSQVQKETANSTASRIKFSVPLFLPEQQR